MKERIGILLAVVVGCAIATAMMTRRGRAPTQVADRVARPSTESKAAPPPQYDPVVVLPPPAPSVPQLPAPRVRAFKSTAPKQTPAPAPVVKAPAQPQPANNGGGKVWVDPVARDALSYVGVDPAAEAVWADAINDPALPPNERKDLIEDLNEDGFADPKRITPDDVPLIASRMALIEQSAPYAMDQVNADAFDEAYKDLTNMLAKASQP
jgi:hypothetical protein